MLNNAVGFEKIYIAVGYTDLRRGLMVWHLLLNFQFNLDPFQKHVLFLFCGKRMYGGYGYGTLESDITELINCGYSVVMPLDICGAVTMKRKFPTLMVYCKKEKGSLIENILERNCSIKEKKLRLLALDQERKNEVLCDLTVEHPEDINKIIQMLY